jgi:pyruvate formate-lyase activating enzyme-like uncharacterized protein
MLNNENDISKLIREAKYIEAKGAGFTGGDPLIVWKRSKNYISILKDIFGPNFHIHLYTSGIKNAEYIADLVSAGLDEIRFHPNPKYWNNMNENPILPSIKTAISNEVDTAIEIPSIPKMENEIKSLLSWSETTGINWINLNELEFSETNVKMLNNRGFEVRDDISTAVKGSQEIAIDIINDFSSKRSKLGVHYCSSSFKDGIQLRNRIKRRAKNVAKRYEIITNEGLLLKGVIYPRSYSVSKINKILLEIYNLNANQFFINREKNRIELSIKILEDIAKDLKKQDIDSYIIEEYPTADCLEVERIPLPL